MKFQLLLGPLSFGLNVYAFITLLATEELRDIKFFHVGLMILCEIIYVPSKWVRTVFRISHNFAQERDYHTTLYETYGLNALPRDIFGENDV